MMNGEKITREQLLSLLQGGNAHMSFEKAIDRFPIEKINTSPTGIPYTPWRLLEHMRIAQWDILEFIRNPEHISPAWPEGHWPAEGEQADWLRWEKTIVGFQEDHKALERFVSDPDTGLFAPLAHAPGYNILREILVVSDHNSYHLGEFALLRQILNAWPVNG
ncbi:MAG TPA: DinB family protein [Anaerolineales bacterium]